MKKNKKWKRASLWSNVYDVKWMYAKSSTSILNGVVLKWYFSMNSVLKEKIVWELKTKCSGEWKSIESQENMWTISKNKCYIVHCVVDSIHIFISLYNTLFILFGCTYHNFSHDISHVYNWISLYIYVCLYEYISQCNKHRHLMNPTTKEI